MLQLEITFILACLPAVSSSCARCKHWLSNSNSTDIISEKGEEVFETLFAKDISDSRDPNNSDITSAIERTDLLMPQTVGRAGNIFAGILILIMQILVTSGLYILLG